MVIKYVLIVLSIVILAGCESERTICESDVSEGFGQIACLGVIRGIDEIKYYEEKGSNDELQEIMPYFAYLVMECLKGYEAVKKCKTKSDIIPYVFTSMSSD